MDGALVHHTDELEVVRDDDDCGALLVDALEQLHDADGVLVVEVAGRLICDQNLRTVDQCAGDGGTLLLATAELARIGIVLLAETDAFEHLRDICADFRSGFTGDQLGEADVLIDGTVLEEPEVLEDDTESATVLRDMTSLHVLQGERPMAAQNKSIGQFNLTGIAPARRGVPQIEVTFDIDANGILNVSAKDKATGKEQSIRIEASSGLSEDEINRMKAEAEQNAAADKAEREKIDKMNQADSMIFTTENFLKDNGDKIPADKKPGIEQALQQLKDAHKAGDAAAIDSAINNLNTVMQAASQQMYQGGQQAGPQGAQGGQQAQGGNDGAQDVQDADFEEVK